jgi:hypothetical protein
VVVYLKSTPTPNLTVSPMSTNSRPRKIRLVLPEAPSGECLPTWEECEDAVQKGNATEVHKFIYSHAPLPDDGEDRWFVDLWALLVEVAQVVVGSPPYPPYPTQSDC